MSVKVALSMHVEDGKHYTYQLIINYWLQIRDGIVLWASNALFYTRIGMCEVSIIF